MNVSYPAHIPETYIPESRDRLHFYKALSSAATEEAAREVESEIRDRFGAFPEELETFMEVVRLKRLLSALKATRADLAPGKVVAAWSDDADQGVLQAIVPWVMQRQDRVRFLPPNRVELRFAVKAANWEHLRQAVVEFSHLAMPPHSLPS